MTRNILLLLLLLLPPTLAWAAPVDYTFTDINGTITPQTNCVAGRW